MQTPLDGTHEGFAEKLRDQAPDWKSPHGPAGGAEAWAEELFDNHGYDCPGGGYCGVPSTPG